MSNIVSKVGRQVFRNFGYEIAKVGSTPSADVAALNALSGFRDGIGKTSEQVRAFLDYCAPRAARSQAQLFQDLFVLRQMNEKRGGFFVEFGATDGVTLSNTYLLETEYGWSGILAEPGRAWHEKLQANRRCTVDLRCVTETSGERVTFHETEWLELSTIGSYAENDHHSSARAGAKRYEVETVSLNDLLRKHDAPRDIDYLSVDTEGSELMILGAFDFDAFRPRVLTVEHNFTPARQDLYALLTSKGYARTLTEVSQFDDWYVLTGSN